MHLPTDLSTALNRLLPALDKTRSLNLNLIQTNLQTIHNLVPSTWTSYLASLSLPSCLSIPQVMTLAGGSYNDIAAAWSALLAAAKAATKDEDRLLNGIWIGLLSVEALMVLGVVVKGVVDRRARRRRMRKGSVGKRRRSLGV
jgi:hypothetical protein